MVKSKGELLQVLDRFYNDIVQRYHHTMKILQGDYDRVHVSGRIDKWLADHSVHLQLYQSAVTRVAGRDPGLPSTVRTVPTKSTYYLEICSS